MPNYEHKIKYLQAYIHFRKQVHVKIRIPQTMSEQNLMNHCYYNAQAYMEKIGKQLRV